MLTGFMGTGKSTVGKRLAERTGREFVDLDHRIESKSGPLSVIFAESGEDAFREMEREAVVEVAALRDQVIATGGGTMLDDANIAALASAQIVTLTASPDAIVERVTADGLEQRPLLNDADDPLTEIERLLAERDDVYTRFTTVDTTDKSVDEVVEAIGEAGIDISATEVQVNAKSGVSSSEKTLYAIIVLLIFVALVLGVVVLSF